MKKQITFLLFGVSLLVPMIVQAQEGFSRTAFKVSPQHFTENSMKVGIERFSPEFDRSFLVFASGMFKRSGEYYELGRTGGGLEVQYRKYVKPLGTIVTKRGSSFGQGIYFSGFAQGGMYSGDVHFNSSYYNHTTQTYTSTETKYNEKISNGAAGFTIGLQRVYWDILYLDLYVGGGVQLAKVDRDYSLQSIPMRYQHVDVVDMEYQGILPKIGFTIGLGI